jgi:hypothetical protein
VALIKFGQNIYYNPYTFQIINIEPLQFSRFRVKSILVSNSIFLFLFLVYGSREVRESRWNPTLEREKNY